MSGTCRFQEHDQVPLITSQRSEMKNFSIHLVARRSGRGLGGLPWAQRAGIKVSISRVGKEACMSLESVAESDKILRLWKILVPVC